MFNSFLLLLAVFGVAGAAVARAFGRHLFQEPSLFSAPARVQLPALAAGPALGYLAAVACVLTQLLIAGQPAYSTVVANAVGPAAAAGIRAGDRVVEIDGQPMTEWRQIPAAVQAAGERNLVVVVERDGQRRSIELRPRDGKIGVSPRLGSEKVAAPEAVARALPLPARAAVDFVRGAFVLVRGREPAELSGPVGMAAQARAAGGYLYVLGVELGTGLPFAVIWQVSTFALFGYRARKRLRAANPP